MYRYQHGLVIATTKREAAAVVSNDDARQRLPSTPSYACTVRAWARRATLFRALATAVKFWNAGIE
jgi:hypothetical protein